MVRQHLRESTLTRPGTYDNPMIQELYENIEGIAPALREALDKLEWPLEGCQCRQFTAKAFWAGIESHPTTKEVTQRLAVRAALNQLAPYRAAVVSKS